MGRHSRAPRPAPASGGALSRRTIVKAAAGVAVAGAATGSVLTGAASPALAADTNTARVRQAIRARQAAVAGRAAVTGQATAATTAVEQGAVAPAVVALTDAATIAVDASLGNDFRLTLGGNRTLADPSNPADGQQVIFQVTQGSGGSFTIAWGSGYEFSADLPQPVLSTAAGQTDLLGFIYNAAKGKWLFAAYVNGFS